MTEHIRPEIQALVDRGNVTSEELKELRCNSWEWEALVPAMSNEVFLDRMQYALDNCFTTSERPFVTYNQSVEGLYAPELIRRFRTYLTTRSPILNNDQLDRACKNIGFDLSCGECAAIFFTGSGGYAHDDSCETHSEAASYAETIDCVREALGQDATHYHVIAGDVKELVEAVERRDDSAYQVLQKLRERTARPPTASSGPFAALPRAPDGNISNCALANADTEENCQMCLARCPDRDRFSK